MITLGNLSRSISQSQVDALLRRGGQAPPPPPPEDDTREAKGMFWKVVGTAALLILGFIGTQLMAVPAHDVQIRDIDRRVVKVEDRVGAIESWRRDEEKRDKEAAARESKLIMLLETEQRRRRGR